MSALSVPAIVMAGITFYVSLYHLLVYFRRRENHVNLSFALTCLAVGLYDVSAAGLYNATGVAEGVQWQRMQFISAALITAAFFRFAMDYLGQGSKRMSYAVAALCALAFILQLVDHSELTWIVSQPSIKDIVLPFGHIIYYEATPGPLSIPQDLLEMAAIIYVLWSGVRSYRRERNQAALPLVVALGIFFVSVANDVAVGIGLYRFIYVVEYAYLSLILLMAYMLSNAIEQALLTAQQRERELAEATYQAQQAAQTAQQAAQTVQQLREHEARIAQQVRQTVQEYAAFLERVAAGDYSSRLVLNEATQTWEGASELVKLGQRLNSTVESLVTALSDLQAVQRRYVREAWSSFAAPGSVQRGFRYQAAKVEPADDAWLPPMSKAVQERNRVTSERELALPVTLRGEVIGAIGARREEQTPWSDDDIALAQSITDQLAQTIEGLRLLDETRRRAARERALHEISDQMQRAPDMEALMRITAEELNKALGGSRAYVRLGTEALQLPNGSKQTDEGNNRDE